MDLEELMNKKEARRQRKNEGNSGRTREGRRGRDYDEEAAVPKKRGRPKKGEPEVLC